MLKKGCFNRLTGQQQQQFIIKLSTNGGFSNKLQVIEMWKSKVKEGRKMENKWIAIYYAVIEKLQQQGRPIGVFKSLHIKSYYVNGKGKHSAWQYHRHHIDEIKISGAHLKEMPEYKTGIAIIVDFAEHLLLHYIIVMANTTSPNHGMYVSIENCKDKIGVWEEYAIEGCKRFGIEFDDSWRENLTLPSFYKGLW